MLAKFANDPALIAASLVVEQPGLVNITLSQRKANTEATILQLWML